MEIKIVSEKSSGQRSLVLKGIGLSGVPGTGAKSIGDLAGTDCQRIIEWMKTKVIGGSDVCKHVAKYFLLNTALDLGLQ
jgi:hypothetical protein